MRKLTKEQLEQRSKMIATLHERKAELEEAIGTFNSTMADAGAGVTDAVAALNEAIAEAESFRSDIHSAMEDYTNDKSDKWKESEAGERYQNWMDGWADSLYDVDIDLPEALVDDPGCDAADSFEGMPEDME